MTRINNQETERFEEIHNSIIIAVLLIGKCFVSNYIPFFLMFSTHGKQSPGPLASRDEFNSVESVEPDPAGFREQVCQINCQIVSYSVPLSIQLGSGVFLDENSVIKRKSYISL